MWKRQTRDVLFRGHVGNLRISGIMAKQTVQDAAKRWQLPLASEATRVWAEYMAGTAMLSSFYKGEERIKCSVRTQSIQDLYVEAMAVGEVRGKAIFAPSFLEQPFGQGQMHVSKILYGATKPYETSARATGLAEADWQTFYDTSEQIPTIVRISSDVQDDHTHCCGVTIQQMPQSSVSEENQRYDINDLRLETNKFLASNVKENIGLIQYLNEVIPDAKLTEENCKRIPLDFFCRCSRKHFATRLQDLGKEELKMVVESPVNSEGVELTCQFCNEIYHFSIAEVENMISIL